MADDVEIIEKSTPYKGYFRIDRYVLRHRTHAGGWTAPMAREIFERGHAVFHEELQAYRTNRLPRYRIIGTERNIEHIFMQDMLDQPALQEAEQFTHVDPLGSRLIEALIV